MSKLSLKAKMSRQQENRVLQKGYKDAYNMNPMEQKAPFGDVNLKALPTVAKIKVSS